MRKQFVIGIVVLLVASVFAYFLYAPLLWGWVVMGPLVLLGLRDFFQKRHAILRNFPVLGHMRYLLELIRPEIHQYFVESDTEGMPFDREQRSLVYQRSKRVRDTVPFGTKDNVYQAGYEWVNHSINPVSIPHDAMNVSVGGDDCSQPYLASLLNISAMSYGSLSRNAVLALSQGAKLGGFAHNTGEGGISPYHLEGGADLIWQIGTGYFGCRTEAGQFNADAFADNAAHDQVKMIELKISQGAKPGHGGILPGAKVTDEIARIRGVRKGNDVISPSGHTAFTTPIELLQFIKQLRDLSGGKPVGFKLCIGKRREFLSICKAMEATGIKPDYIAIDGGEGGTGAAPLEFTNHIGSPLTQSLIFAHNALTGFSMRSDIRIFASGKISSAFEMLRLMSLGADACYSARAMMLAIGCIQALKCNSNHCPTGVATQNSGLMAGLDPADKAARVANYHHETIESLCEMMGAMGIQTADDLRPWHVMHRLSPTETRHYGEMYDFLSDGDLLLENPPECYRRALEAASPDSFHHLPTVGKKFTR